MECSDVERGHSTKLFGAVGRVLLFSMVGMGLADHAGAEERDWFATAGYLYVSPDDSLNGPISGPGLPPGNGVALDEAHTAFFSVGYYLNDHWNLEFLVDVPPTIDVAAAGSIDGLGELADTQAATPTLFITYNFNDADAAFRPYVGIGAVYTKFVNTDGSAVLSAALGGPTDVDLDDDLGWAVQAGVNYDLSERWFFNATVGFLSIETTADLSTPAVGTTRTVDVDVNPFVAKTGFGFRF